MWFDENDILIFYRSKAGYRINNDVYICKDYQCGETYSLNYEYSIHWITRDELNDHLSKL